MLSVQLPTPRALAAFLETQRNRPFSYPEVGATRGTCPSGYFVDHRRTLLGHGQAAFDAACQALRSWQPFKQRWVKLHDDRTPLAAGEVVAIVGGRLSLFATNACRIVYTLDEDGRVRRFGFAYGTLPDHIERGEERFCVEWRRDDDTVWYDLLAFSWPNHFVAQCCLPYIRRLQKRFGRDSAQAMLSAVQAATSKPEPIRQMSL